MSPGDGEESELPPPGSILARYATIVAQGFDLEYAIRLTPAQINLVHGHRRDDDGNIKQPEAPVKARKPLPQTYENMLASLDRVATTGLISVTEYKRARAEIVAKFGPPEDQAQAEARPQAPAKIARQQPRAIPRPRRPGTK